MLDAQIDELQRTVHTDPDDARAHLLLGMAFERAGQARPAGRAFSTAARLEPEGPLAHYCMGRLWESQGDLWQAVRAYDAALLHDAERKALPGGSRLLSAAERMGRELIAVAEGRASPVANLTVNLFAYLNEYGVRTIRERVPLGTLESRALALVAGALARDEELPREPVALARYARSYPATRIGPRGGGGAGGTASSVERPASGRDVGQDPGPLSGSEPKTITFRRPVGFLAVSYALRAEAVRRALSALVLHAGPAVDCSACGKRQPGVHLPCAEGLVHWNRVYCGNCGAFVEAPGADALASRPASDLLPLLKLADLVEHLVVALGTERLHLRLHPRRVRRMRVRDLLVHVCDLTVGRLWEGPDALAAPFDYGELAASIGGTPLRENQKLEQLPRQRIDLTLTGRAPASAQQAAAAIAARFWGDRAGAA